MLWNAIGDFAAKASGLGPRWRIDQELHGEVDVLSVIAGQTFNDKRLKKLMTKVELLFEEGTRRLVIVLSQAHRFVASSAGFERTMLETAVSMTHCSALHERRIAEFCRCDGIRIASVDKSIPV